MDTVTVKHLNSADEIYRALVMLADNLYNQAFNKPEKLWGLAEKFFEKANVLVARDDHDTVKGLCAFYNNDKRTQTGYLSIIVVAKEVQGRGYGRALLQKMMEQCAERGMRRIRLEVDNTNWSAIQFYVRKGFVLEKKMGGTSYYIYNLDT